MKFYTTYPINSENLAKFKARAWVEFRYANIKSSYSEAKYAVSVSQEEVLVSGDLTWEGNPLDIGDNLELRGEIKLPREGIWEITGYIEAEGSGSSIIDKLFQEQIRVAVTKDAAAVMGTREFISGPLAYLDNFSYGRVSGRMVPDEQFRPTILEIDISRVPGIGEEALVSCTIRSLYDVSDYTAEFSFIRRTDENPYLKVPGDSLLVSGNLKWEGDLKPDEPAEFSATIRLPEGGDWRIQVLGDNPRNPGNLIGDGLNMNISGNIRSFGWEERPSRTRTRTDPAPEITGIPAPIPTNPALSPSPPPPIPR
jgi:hypothetical protein